MPTPPTGRGSPRNPTGGADAGALASGGSLRGSRPGDGVPKGMEERTAKERDPVAKATPSPEGMEEMAAEERDPTAGSTPSLALPPLPAELVRPVKML